MRSERDCILQTRGDMEVIEKLSMAVLASTFLGEVENGAVAIGAPAPRRSVLDLGIGLAVRVHVFVILAVVVAVVIRLARTPLVQNRAEHLGAVLGKALAR